jgi:hypothetical protein
VNVYYDWIENNSDYQQVRWSYDLGIGVGCKFNNYLTLMIELNYVSKGYEYQYEASKIPYLDFPILLNLRFLRVLSFELGPEFGVCLKEPAARFNNKSYKYNTFEISGCTSITLTLYKLLDLGIRYSHAFTPSEEYEFMDGGQGKTYNKYTETYIRLNFPIK